MNAETILKILLRFIGFNSLLALIFVFAPYAWMDAIHSRLGMGPMPDEPVVGYLARSTSAFYALLGGLFWTISFDPRRYRSVLSYLGAALVVFGVILTGVDWREGLPLFWRLWEGPFTSVFGGTLFLLTRAIPRESTDGV